MKFNSFITFQINFFLYTLNSIVTFNKKWHFNENFCAPNNKWGNWYSYYYGNRKKDENKEEESTTFVDFKIIFIYFENNNSKNIFNLEPEKF